MTHDPIGDFFIRIKNAHAVQKPTVSVNYSQLNQSIAEVLKRSGFISDFVKKGRGPRRRMELVLSYRNEVPVISNFKRRSKPGQRAYVGWRDLYPVKNGYGIGIVSTSHGVMSDKDARAQKLGGELIVEIW